MKRFAFWALLVASLSANLAMAAVAVWQRSPARPGEPLLFSKVALAPDQRRRIPGIQLERRETCHRRRRRFPEQLHRQKF